jgi:hypothetical protein
LLLALLLFSQGSIFFQSSAVGCVLTWVVAALAAALQLEQTRLHALNLC